MKRQVPVLLAIVAFYWASSLSFFPVPWPDDSAFFLSGLELVSWPPRWRMHAQAPFIPSYDIANFNIMPGLSFILGLAYRLGLTTDHAFRLLGMAVFAAWAALLGLWLRRRKAAEFWCWAIPLGAILSPAARWGAMVVRTEIWQALLWTAILMELDGAFQRKSRWRLPALLAIAAYIHYEAIVWVAPVALAVLMSSRGADDAWRTLVGIGWRAAALLTPWILFVLWHWNLFWSQMDTQFHRLSGPHPYASTLYGFVHYLFISLGNPVSYPKFFNIGKALTWGMLIFTLGLNLWRAYRNRVERPVRVAASAAIFTTFYLWMNKPETWFTTLIHAAIWPLAALAVSRATSVSRFPEIMGRLAVAALIVVQAGVAGQHWWKTRETFTWSNYRSWVDCVDSTIGDRTKIWQPHWPDMLVELAGRKPDRDYTRAVDFQNIAPLIRAHAEKSEVIIHSLFRAPDETGSREDHTGEPRPGDLHFVTDYPWIPFKEHAAPKMGPPWRLTVCQRGPFWAGISLR